MTPAAFRRLIAALVILLAALALQPVKAHGYIVRAIPEDRAVLERAPARLQYWFSEPLEIEFSALNVRDQNGDVVASGGVSENDDSLMTLRLPPDLPDGAYIVELRPAFKSDGHVVAESRVFFVGEEVGGVAGSAATDDPIPLEALWRAITLVAMMTIFGASTLYTYALVPAWGNKKYAVGLLPPRVMRRLYIMIGLALAALVIGNSVALVQQTAAFFGVSVSQAVNPDFWSVVRIGSRFGDVWNYRMGLIIVAVLMLAAGLVLRGDQPQSMRAFITALAWIMALVIGSSSVLSHAAGSLTLPWLAIAVDWIHALAVAAWTGGLVALVLLIGPALQPYRGDDRRRALLAVLNRFSPLAAAMLVVVVATGIFSATLWITAPRDAVSTYGAALALKLILVAGLVALGALHHAALRPERYARLQTLADRVSGFTGSLRLEALAVVVTLGAVGILSATPVPTPEFAEAETPAPTSVQITPGYTLVLTLAPGGPGVNTLDITATSESERLPDLQVDLVTVHPARDRRVGPQIAEAVEPGLYVAATDAIDRPGRWWTLLDVATPAGDSRRIAVEWDITEAASVIDSTPPRPAVWLALLGVIAASGVALYPLAKRVYVKLDLSPLTLTVAFSAIAASAVLIIGGFALLNDTRQTYDETINPPPTQVNAVLPTQASLDRGQRLFDANCRAAWEADPGDFEAFTDRLDRARDEELLEAIRDGWRDLPACAESLSLFERWDVVNYLRTLRAELVDRPVSI